MPTFKEGELARIKESHHKIAPKGSIVRVLRQFRGVHPTAGYWTTGRWITFEPLVQRGKAKKYTWDERKFEKLS